MTMTLLGVVSCQMLNAWSMRSWEFSAFSLGIFSNRLMVAAMAVNLVWILTLLNLTAVQRIFNTAAVPPHDLWLLLPFPLLLFTTHELYKWRRRRRERAWESPLNHSAKAGIVPGEPAARRCPHCRVASLQSFWFGECSA
ncbi:MAG: hypothetical protein HGA96_03740 [Desulfobulbaceae bacterium]|nr:hypothetical protein [Desulfobulbaceae bacterium]